MANFAESIKIAIMSIKTTFENSTKVKKKKKIEIMQWNEFFLFLYITKVAGFWWKMMMPSERKECFPCVVCNFNTAYTVLLHESWKRK